MMAPVVNNENQQMMPEELSMEQIEQGAANEGVTRENVTLDGVSPMSGEGEATNFVITPDQFVSTLDEEIIGILETKLTPAMRRALGLMLGPEIENILNNIGLQEPQHLVPQSVIAQAFPAQTIEESITMFDQQLMGQSGVQAGAVPAATPSTRPAAMPQDIPGPPQGGLGGMPEGIPQTNVPPVV